MKENFANPSSRHSLGLLAEKTVSEARRKVSQALSCSPDEVYFTSGGTESDNIAILGSANIKKGKRIITTSVEHPAVLRCMDYLEGQGFEVIKIKPQPDGTVSFYDIADAITPDTVLVSVMHVNNETGAVMPIDKIGGILKRIAPRSLFHVDAVQSFGHIAVKPSQWGVDLMSVSSHKIHGPKGVGGIYLKAKNIIKPYMLGGEQESNIFAGTQGTPAIIGFGVAAEEAKDIKANAEKVTELKNYLVENIKDLKSVKINSPEDSIPYILNISILGLPSQPIVNFMSERNIQISAGSACKMGHRSPVLTAMGLDSKIIDSAVRISFSRYNTLDEVEQLIEAIKEINNKYGKG
jgi:cysteine desulfurase